MRSSRVAGNTMISIESVTTLLYILNGRLSIGGLCVTTEKCLISIGDVKEIYIVVAVYIRFCSMGFHTNSSMDCYC